MNKLLRESRSTLPELRHFAATRERSRESIRAEPVTNDNISRQDRCAVLSHGIVPNDATIRNISKFRTPS